MNYIPLEMIPTTQPKNMQLQVSSRSSNSLHKFPFTTIDCLWKILQKSKQMAEPNLSLQASKNRICWDFCLKLRWLLLSYSAD